MIVIVTCLLALSTAVLADLPCASRAVSGESNLCVCNATYCDTTTRTAPSAGTFVVYKTSEEGQRLEKSTGNIENYNTTVKYSTTIKIDATIKYQSMKGFGGAVTDSAALNWKNVSEAVQQHLINSYCSGDGLEYNMLRVPIGGCDFSTRAYTYNELPEDDAQLSNFTLTNDDYDYKIPMIKACEAVSTAAVRVVATTWSPPSWMKTNEDITGISRLKSQFYRTYALYHMKFLEEYKKADVDVWALTTTNEPFNGLVPIARFNSLGWTPGHMGQWIEEDLGPLLRNSSFKDVKILSVDDQRFMVPIWFNWVVRERPSVLQWIDGVAVHWYGDAFTPPAVLDAVARSHPEKFLLGTEACEGSFPWQLRKVRLGSWDRAANYIKNIIEDITHHVTGWIDWNLCLNPTGGPNWANNFVDSPIIVYSEQDEIVKQPMFYAMGHFSKFVPRESVRVDVDVSGHSVRTVAFLTPKNTVVAVVYNERGSKTVRLNFGTKQAVVSVQANSITTVELTEEDAQ